MNHKTKTTLRLVLMVAVMSWALASTASEERWGLFWLNLGAILFALFVGLVSPLFTSKTRKAILKNMTRDERADLARIGEQAGKRLGLRVMPFAFLIAFFSMLFGVTSLFYTIPLSICLLFILCLPVWRSTREQTNAMLLATAFAQANGIESLKGTANHEKVSRVSTP